MMPSVLTADYVVMANGTVLMTILTNVIALTRVGQISSVVRMESVLTPASVAMEERNAIVGKMNEDVLVDPMNSPVCPVASVSVNMGVVMVDQTVGMVLMNKAVKPCAIP